MTCELCPRRCGVRPGYCGAGALPRVFRYGPHFGEEPPLTGGRGSGCVFFSRCTMRCLYCQNSPWSWQGEGRDLEIGVLTDIFRRLAIEDKVENFNLVSPTPYLPEIRAALLPLRSEGIALPVVWNSSGYERVETLSEYAGLCDVALFDLRYSRSSTALAASGAKDYVEYARAAVKWAWARPPRADGLPRLIVRILVLPGHAEEAIESLAFVATELGNDVPVSVMAQYTPAYRALKTPPFDRPVTRAEYESVTEAAADFGFEQGWIQGYEASDPKLALLGENMSAGHGSVR